LAEAWAQGRITAEQIVDFKQWVKAQALSHPAFQQAADKFDQAEGSGA
jgi:hypothetical protein